MGCIRGDSKHQPSCQARPDRSPLRSDHRPEWARRSSREESLRPCCHYHVDQVHASSRHEGTATLTPKVPRCQSAPYKTTFLVRSRLPASERPCAGSTREIAAKPDDWPVETCRSSTKQHKRCFKAVSHYPGTSMSGCVALGRGIWAAIVDHHRTTRGTFNG
ncbi:hypothetical protein BGZ61DRAFT_516574 [Ilyonectria robusta]|uniref:uncharacterized protein n=1 Tax=Ilyonectria robusta TaxID=1079257 RepID=UPI001E8ED657|nr:uncharacterized protein BGZ61DRAFT_516574 [Ilyonectria robusta]KAH8714317.1 hypothetical protein BGZ61DRAFT_516574 [Ilyonectria robusta]